MLQALVQVDLLGGHRLRLDDQPGAASPWPSSSTKVGHFGAVLAVDHLAAVRGDVGFELFEVVDRGCSMVCFLRAWPACAVPGSRAGRPASTARLALVHQPAGGGVDGQLQARIGQGIADARIGNRSIEASQRLASTSARCRVADGQAGAGERALESASGNWNRARPRRRRRCARWSRSWCGPWRRRPRGISPRRFRRSRSTLRRRPSRAGRGRELARAAGAGLP